MTIALNTYTRSLVLYLALGILEETFNSPNFIDDDDELFLWYEQGPLPEILTIANLWHAMSMV